jgi:hypothetical protein
MNNITLPGSPALWAGSFTFRNGREHLMRLKKLFVLLTAVLILNFSHPPFLRAAPDADQIRDGKIGKAGGGEVKGIKIPRIEIKGIGEDTSRFRR